MKMRLVSVMFLLAGMLAVNAQNGTAKKKEIIANGGFIQTPITNVAYTPTRSVAGLPDLTVAAENSVNAVVHIKVETKQRTMMRGDMDDDPFFNFFFGPNGGGSQRQLEPQKASGSGVIISTDGYIVTNNHVVSEADNIQVVLNDKRTFTATVIGTDPNTDIALLKIEAKDLPTLVFGNSDDLKLGEWVLAIGNPFNLTSTVTAGIVSAKARNINIISSKTPIESFIQTDAAINPGNSGGALVNTKGELIGINTAIASQTGSYAGYGFAVPVSIVSKVVADIKQYGAVQRALMGVQIRDIDDDFAKEKKIKVLDGVYVAEVNDLSAAKDAGIKEGDIITKINGVAVKSSAELQEQVGRHRPGDKIDVSFVREGKDKTVAVTLKNQQGDTKVVKNKGMEVLGASLEEVGDDLKQKLRISGGVQVVGLQKNSLLSEAGVQKGFVIIKINNKPIRKVTDLEGAVKANNSADEQDRALFITGIYPNGKVAYYAIDPTKD
ncbi:Do family serine endopeptidase [Paludibacter jiangxiensis]|uniref:Do/DeqQ family serine protease n=1 Tax=Paludibacter jiangxiensis TaxID=681398 RepID=A0A171ABP8_9BACT|nr:Do family serine endopeptidase [Paludibacter jiangxiensis]GAT63490.1 Do/DeqQ family serine protease [Paludibacter jiangxiensis]